MKIRRWVRSGKLKLTRDSILFISGLVGIGYETMFTHQDRPSLLFLFGAMIGLPAFLRTDEKRTPNAPSQPAPPTVPGDPAGVPWTPPPPTSPEKP